MIIYVIIQIHLIKINLILIVFHIKLMLTPHFYINFQFIIFKLLYYLFHLNILTIIIFKLKQSLQDVIHFLKIIYFIKLIIFSVFFMLLINNFHRHYYYRNHIFSYLIYQFILY